MSIDFDKVHAHISQEAADCDGRHGHDYVARPHSDEDDYYFKQRIVACMVSLHNEGTLTVEQGEDFSRFRWTETTDEGWSREEALICYDDCGNESSVYDQFAEMAGY